MRSTKPSFNRRILATEARIERPWEQHRYVSWLCLQRGARSRQLNAEVRQADTAHG